jgi:hypothetical protein
MLHLKMGEQKHAQPIAEASKTGAVRGLELADGPIQLEAWVTDSAGERGARFVEVRRLEERK